MPVWGPSVSLPVPRARHVEGTSTQCTLSATRPTCAGMLAPKKPSSIVSSWTCFLLRNGNIACNCGRTQCCQRLAGRTSGLISMKSTLPSPNLPPGGISNHNPTPRGCRASATSTRPASSIDYRSAAKPSRRAWPLSSRCCAAEPSCRPWHWKTSPAGCSPSRPWSRTMRSPQSATWRKSTKLCAILSASSRDSPRTPRPSWLASPAASNCSKPRSMRWSTISALIDYLERFMGDLVRRSDTIARTILAVSPDIDPILRSVADREARDAAPGDSSDQADERDRRWQEWRERWKGLSGWFLPAGHDPPQAELLRARARAAIPQLLNAVAALNERRSGRSDRSADFRILAGWFAACSDDGEADRLARAAFALNPARHFLLNAATEEDLPASTRWADAPPLQIHPRLREYGEVAPRGPLASVRDRREDRARLERELTEESQQVEAARQRLATGEPIRLSEIGHLDSHAFGLFLSLLGEALGEQCGPDTAVERLTGDGLLRVRLDPLAAA